MSDIYTAYVESLAGGEPPAPERDEEVCRQLRTDLRWALTRRGLWHASPALLGGLGRTWAAESLDDLVHDAYLYNFAERLWHLHDRLLLGAELRPLVLANLEHFLSERQKAVDPIGRRIYVRLKAALEAAVTAGRLFLLNATPAERERLEIGNLTLVGFSRGLAAVASPEVLAEAVRGWPEELFADLVGAETNAVKKVVARLERQVLDLAAAGVKAFRFKDLADLVKGRARRRWQSALGEELGEIVAERAEPDAPAAPVVIVRPDDEPDGARRLVLLVRCVSRRISELADERRRRELWQVWEMARSCAARGAPRPSMSRVSRELGIARERRLPDLYAELGDMVEQCRKCLGLFCRADGNGRADGDRRKDDRHRGNPREQRRWAKEV